MQKCVFSFPLLSHYSELGKSNVSSSFCHAYPNWPCQFCYYKMHFYNHAIVTWFLCSPCEHGSTWPGSNQKQPDTCLENNECAQICTQLWSGDQSSLSLSYRLMIVGDFQVVFTLAWKSFAFSSYTSPHIFYIFHLPWEVVATCLISTEAKVSRSCCL